MPSAVLAILLRIAVTIACVVLAYVGFAQAYPVEGHRSLAASLDLAYKAVQLTFGQFPADLRNRTIPLILQVARFALPLTAAWVTLSLGWIQLRNRIRSVLIRRRGDHLVVFGDGRLAESLVAGERARKGGLIAWTADGAARIARDAEALGGAYAAGRPDALDLRGLGLDSARAFVAVADNDAINLVATRRALDHALEHRPPGDPLQIIARIDDPALQAALEARPTRREQRDRVELRLVSAPQLVARQFLLENPVDRLGPEQGRPLRLGWLGWSPLAESMLTRVLAASHFRSGGPPELVVADLQATRAEAAFRSRRQGAFDVAPISFVALPDDAPSLIADWAAGQSAEQPFAALYVTLPGSSAALSTALALETAFARRRLSLPPLYVHLPEASAAAPDLVDDTLAQAFGSLSALADPEVLLQERQDEIARSIHDFYLEGRLNEGEALGDRPTLAEWADLPESVREENRLVADCYVFKLRDMGAAVVQGAGPSLRFTEHEVEDLAQAEHRRWMAAKLLDGWTYGETRDDRARRHPDIIPYEALSEPIKELDREQIRMIPRILGASGRRALRDLIVEVEAGQGAPPTLEMVRGKLAAVQADHPDRRLLLRGDPSDAGARATLLHAKALGYGCQLRLARPAHEVVDAAPSAERAAVARLIRSADRVYGPGSASVAPADILLDLREQPQASQSSKATRVAPRLSRSA